MPERSSPNKQLFESMLKIFLEWDGVYDLDSIDRALLKTEANSVYKISKEVDKNLRARFISTAKGQDLDIIGEGMNRPRLAGETDEAFKKRLIINDTFFNDATLKGLKSALRGYFGIDVDNDGENDTDIIEIYNRALKGGSGLKPSVKFLGEEVKEGAIEVHLMMTADGDEVIISRTELFGKMYRTRAAGILLYLYWHGNHEDSLRKILSDKTSLTGKSRDITFGRTVLDGHIIGLPRDDHRVGLPIIQRHDVFDGRTKGNSTEQDYDILVGTDNGAAKIAYKDKGGTEDNAPGKRYEDDVSHGEMSSRRVHRLLDGEQFALPKDFQTPLRMGQREEIVVFNHSENKSREVLRIAPVGTRDIRLRIDDSGDEKKAILQVVPKEYNGYDLVYFDDEILTDYLMSGKWSNLDEVALIENGNIQLSYNSQLDEYSTSGYYISPPIHIDDITKFGMIKWVYDTGDISAQIRTGTTEETLNEMDDGIGWGPNYSTNTGEFIQENANEFFQFKINLTGTIYKTPIFRLSELFIEYWDIPTSEIEEEYDNVLTGDDLVTAASGSAIGDIILMPSNARGNGGSLPGLDLQELHWITSVQPVRMPRIRNRRWTLFYGVKLIITQYFSREFIHKYEREVEVL